MTLLNRLLLVALLATATTGTGCVYVNGENIGGSDWQDEQRNNREAISNLKLGLSISEVREKLGAPADSEAFANDGVEVRVLYYRTTRKHSDGETTRDETTPLVFRDDELVGWGDSVYRQYR